MSLLFDNEESVKISDQEKSISRVLRAVKAIENRGMVIMVDEEDRENEGDIVFAADHVSADLVNFMTRHARGLICLALEPSYISKLELPMMRDAGKSESARETAFTVSIEAKRGVTTGISAADRAETIRVAVNPNSRPDDLAVPGHIFPLKARHGGVLERAGHTEGSVDLAKLAGCSGSAVICEIMKDDGTMARRPDLEVLSEKFEIPIVSIADLIAYRLMQETHIELETQTQIKTSRGVFEAQLFRSKLDNTRHLAIIKGDSFGEHVIDVRVHLQRPISDVFADPESVDGNRISQGLDILDSNDRAVFVYLCHPDSAGLLAKDLESMSVSDVDHKALSNAVVMDPRVIGIGSQILCHLGVKKMRVHAYSEKSYKGISGFGLEVTEHVLIK